MTLSSYSRTQHNYSENKSRSYSVVVAMIEGVLTSTVSMDSNTWSESTSTSDTTETLSPGSGNQATVTTTTSTTSKGQYGELSWDDATGPTTSEPTQKSIVPSSEIPSPGSLSGGTASAIAVPLLRIPQPSYLDSSGSGLYGPPIVVASQIPLPTAPLAAFVAMPLVGELTGSLRRDPPFLTPLSPGQWNISPAALNTGPVSSSGYIWYGSENVDYRLHVPLSEWAQEATAGQWIDQLFISLIGRDNYGRLTEFLSNPVVRTVITVSAAIATGGMGLGPMLAINGFVNFVMSGVSENGFDVVAGAIGAVTTIVSMGLGSAVSSYTAWMGNRLVVDLLANTAVGMASNAFSQGLNIYFGYQESFSWGNLAISGLTAAGGTLVARGASRMFNLTRSSGAANCNVSQTTFVAANALAHGVGGFVTNAAAQYIVNGEVNWGEAALAGAQDAVMGGISARNQWRYNRQCFRGHMQLIARGAWGTGLRRIDCLTDSDEVISRDEFHLMGELSWKRIQEVFVRSSYIWQVKVNGRMIDATDEHRFFVKDKGWTRTIDLEAGDQFNTEEGNWVTVEEVRETGEYDTVYNVRIADFHTYFVGEQEWGFSVWSHNACDLPIGGTRPTHGSTPHNDTMNDLATHPALPAGVTPVRIRTNQAIMNPANPDGPALSPLRPDVQVLGSDGRLYFTEVNRTGGSNYHGPRRNELRAALPSPSLFGGYTPVDI